jgi:hypothetical protein
MERIVEFLLVMYEKNYLKREERNLHEDGLLNTIIIKNSKNKKKFQKEEDRVVV